MVEMIPWKMQSKDQVAQNSCCKEVVMDAGGMDVRAFDVTGREKKMDYRARLVVSCTNNYSPIRLGVEIVLD